MNMNSSLRRTIAVTNLAVMLLLATGDSTFAKSFAQRHPSGTLKKSHWPNRSKGLILRSLPHAPPVGSDDRQSTRSNAKVLRELVFKV